MFYCSLPNWGPKWTCRLGKVESPGEHILAMVCVSLPLEEIYGSSMLRCNVAILVPELFESKR